MKHRSCLAAALTLTLTLCAAIATAQVAPSAEQVARYTGLHAAAQRGDLAAIARERAAGADPNARDPQGRTSASSARTD